jgi:hypothetical protein
MNQHMRPEPVPFYDLGSQRRRLGTSIDEAISRVTSHCLFINGPEVAVLEKALADFCGARHVVSCASGTDALLMVLMAKDVAVAMRCSAVVHLLRDRRGGGADGATPVFVDVDEATFNMDWTAERGMWRAGTRPQAEGRIRRPVRASADHDASAGSQAENLFVLDDAARLRSHLQGPPLGTRASAPHQLFPANRSLLRRRRRSSPTMRIGDTLRSLRVHGQGDKYDNVRLGLTAAEPCRRRSDREAENFPDEIAARNRSRRYARASAMS